MELEQIRSHLQSVLKDSRYLHSVGVEEVAGDLAVIHGYNPDEAMLAGLLHDCAKYLTDEELLQECNVYQLPISEIERSCPFLLHGKVGAIYASNIYGVTDQKIINSILYHTTGRPKMELLEKIIFTADYIEPYRKSLPRINDIRQAAYSDIDLAVYMVLENVLHYLQDSGSKIDKLTEETYHYYKEVLQNRNR